MERDEAIRIATGSGYGVDRMTILEAAATLVDADPTPLSRRLLTLVQGVQDALTAATARAEKAEAERDAYAKAKAENDERFQLEAAKWHGLYAKAWAECERWRKAHGRRYMRGLNADRGYEWINRRGEATGTKIVEADAHDAARKEAGL